MSEKFKKCDKEGCCKHLLDRCVYSGKGFHMIHTVNLKDRVGSAKSRFRGVAYKANAKDRGIMLNWCPFCGGQPGDFKRPGGNDAGYEEHY